jgi:hypothetical protein
VGFTEETAGFAAGGVVVLVAKDEVGFPTEEGGGFDAGCWEKIFRAADTEELAGFVTGAGAGFAIGAGAGAGFATGAGVGAGFATGAGAGLGAEAAGGV